MNAKALAGAVVPICSTGASGSDGVVDYMKANPDGVATGGSVSSAETEV